MVFSMATNEVIPTDGFLTENSEESPSEIVIQRATLEEELLFKDSREDCERRKVPFRGVLVNKNTGEPVENLVVQLGREFALRKLFNIVPSVDSTLDNFNRRVISCFGVGIGGTPLGDPNNPIPPTPADSSLNTPVSLITTTSGTSSIYLDRVTNGVEFNWMKKKFTGSPTIVLNSTTDEYYVKVTLSILNTEVRGRNINELSLFTGRDTTTTVGAFTNFIMFNRLTFSTEFFPTDNTKALEYDYYLYV